MNAKVKQHDITDCGAACIASVCAHYQLRIPIARIRQQAGTDQRGTNLLGMIKALERLGISAKGVKGNPEALTTIPLPAIAHLVTPQGLHHYVVIYQVRKSGLKIMDPRSGKMEKWSITNFTNQWTGVLLLLAPVESFTPGNEVISPWQRFGFLLRPHRSRLLQALVGAVIYTLLGLSFPIYIQKITDQVLGTGNANLLNLLSLCMVAIVLMQVIINWMKSLFVLQTGQLIDASLILGYYRHILALPQRFFDTMRTGEILSRFGDALKIRSFINDVAINAVVSVLIILFSFGLMFTYYWKFAVITLITIPLYLGIYWVSNYLNKRWERKLMEDAAALESQFVESLQNVRTIKQFGLEHFASLKTEQRFVTLLQSIFQSGKNHLGISGASETVNRLFTVGLLWVGSYYVLQQQITPGELLSFYALVGYFSGPVTSLIGMNKTFQNAWIAADRLFEIFDLEQEAQPSHQFTLDAAQLGDIDLENVRFSYGTRQEVFRDLSLQIPHGTMVGVVGESGCGKSTLAAILQRLYPISAGKIMLGRTNLAFVDQASLRKLIGVVPQQVEIFAGSVLDNICLGDPFPNMEKVREVCEQLGLEPFLESLPAGLGTELGEQGANLSGGQKQRLGIARALYRDPAILILDEATSSLDPTAEVFVQRTLEQLRNQGKTIIIIAHRLRTVMDADKIIVLREGVVCEEGSHQELLQGHGAYFELWEKQFVALAGGKKISWNMSAQVS